MFLPAVEMIEKETLTMPELLTESDFSSEELTINLNLLSGWHFDHQHPCPPSLDPEIRFSAINIPILGSVSKWSLAEGLSANKNQKRQRTLHQSIQLGTIFIQSTFPTFVKFVSFASFILSDNPSFAGILGLPSVKGDISQIFACKQQTDYNLWK